MTSLYTTTVARTKSLHSGKWTHEESEYVRELIKEFEAGSLNIEENISLRAFLSKALNCSPKRISKVRSQSPDGSWSTPQFVAYTPLSFTEI